MHIRHAATKACFSATKAGFVAATNISFVAAKADLVRTKVERTVERTVSAATKVAANVEKVGLEVVVVVIAATMLALAL